MLKQRKIFILHLVVMFQPTTMTTKQQEGQFYFLSNSSRNSGISPSPVRNITMVMYTINEFEGLINFTLSWFPPHYVAGNISKYLVTFGGSIIPSRQVIEIEVGYQYVHVHTVVKYLSSCDHHV